MKKEMNVMSFPNFPEDINPNIDFVAEQVALLLLATIAFEELALAHVINAEAEKLQAALGTLVDPVGTTVFPGPLATDLDDLLDTNRSVEKILSTVIKKEMLLEFKLEDLLDFLATVTTTTTGAPGACDCSVGLIDFGPTTGVTTAIIATPPILVTPDSTLEIFADLCSDCDPTDNAFEYEFIRPAQTDPENLPLVRQAFVAETFNISCDPTNTVMTVTGEGTASGQGPGHVSGQFDYELILDETTNTLTLTLTRGPNFFVGVHDLTPVFDIVIEDC
jgi:hypothetical protein